MLIDWFTVAAQVINFLILVVVLRLFLYKPVLTAMTQRQERIDAGFEEAERREREAAEAAEASRAELRRAQEEHQQKRSAIDAELERMRDQRLTKLREEIAGLRTSWRQGVAQEQGRLLQEIRARVGEAAKETAQLALASLAGTDLEQRMAETFLAQLGRVGGEERQALLSAMEGAGHIEVLSSAPLPAGTRSAIEEALAEHLAHRGATTFRHDEALSCGIELRAGGRSLGWSLDRFLAATQASYEDLLEAEAAKTGSSEAPTSSPEEPRG